MTLRMNVVWEVLDMAKDVRDFHIWGACRRLIIADRLGWRKYHDPADMALILDFATVMDSDTES